MITDLHVKNLALIDEADVPFRPGLNILTGETGAGKSILLGSIDLALGRKMSSDMIRRGADHALVELVFEIGDPATLEKLGGLGIDTEEGVLVLSRKITDGKSICRLNGETCTASRLREISSLLLDIHGQHEHQSLLYPERQLEILDAYGKDSIAPLLSKTSRAYEKWRGAKEAMAEFEVDESARAREISLMEHEINEIESAHLTDSEDEETEREYRRMSEGRRIAETLGDVHRLTGDDGAADAVGMAVQRMNTLSDIDDSLASLAGSLADIEGLLADFNRETSSYMEGLSFSDEDLARVEARLDLINTLKTKYGRTIGDIDKYLEDRKEQLALFERFDERKRQAEENCQRAQEELEKASEELSLARRAAASRLTDSIKEELADLNFPAVGFNIAFNRGGSYRRNGTDEIGFMISTNPGEPLRPLSAVASGGELSRIMLAIKALLADKDKTETLLFDEIDTGVSGKTAQRVAEKMAKIGRTHQVLCVTHLAQIAAMADHHFCITKDSENGSTATHIEELTGEGSIEEMARILGGDAAGEAAMVNAREMKRAASQRKQEL